MCRLYFVYSKISTDPGLLKIRHSHRFVAVVIQILIPRIGPLPVNVENPSERPIFGNTFGVKLLAS